MKKVSKEIIQIAIKNGASDASLIGYDLICNINFNLNLENYPDELNYLKNEKRKNPVKWFNNAKSILICIYQYWHSSFNYESIISKITDPYDFLKVKYKNIKFLNRVKKEKFKISRYALVDEYHSKIKGNLNLILSEIKKYLNENINAKIFVDSAPVVEKKLAELSNMGFQGKNTLFIHRDYGTYVFIGGIIFDTEFQTEIKSEIKKDNILCKKCNICEVRCPTKALENWKLTPKKCISFWTTHNKTEFIPEEIINSSDYIFGCDICQEFCPYNKHAGNNIKIFKINNQ